MRISTSYIQQQSVDAMLAQQKKLTDTQQQVSTGSRILSPSDDPVASVKILGLERDMSVNEQYKENATSAENKLSIAEGALTSAVNILQRIRELAVQALNDTNDANARAGMAAEMQELNEALVALANSKDSNGEYLFSGYQSFTQSFDPTSFAYGGDTGQRNIRVGSNYMVESTEAGSDIFVVTNADTTTQSIFATVQGFVDALNANTIGTAPNDGEILTNTSTAIDSITSARTRIGARLSAIDQQRTINDDSIASLQKSLSELRDLDYAEAISRLSIQSTGLEAAQQAYVRVQGLSLFNYL
jgi:flagellar hook-associated protein 3 FlgL